MGISALAFLLCPYPPMVDYPQHLAMGSLLRRMADPASPESALYETNRFTYNAGIETLISLLSFVVSSELAGRIILAVNVIVFALAALALCDVAKRPRWYALLAVPLVYNYFTGWGFANYTIAVPMALLTCAGFLRIVRGERSRLLFAGVVLSSMFVAYTHVLAMLAICVTIAIVSLRLLFGRNEDGLVERVKRLIAPAIVMVPSVAYCLGAWWWARKTSTSVWEHQWAEGQDDPAWQKLRFLLFNATGNFSDSSDQYFVVGAVVAAIAIVAYSDDDEQPSYGPMRALCYGFAALYVFIPKVFIATFHIYARFLIFAMLFGMVSLPIVRRSWKNIAAAASILAILCSLNLIKKFLTIPEVDDAMAIINDAPANRSLVGVTWSPAPPTYFREIWVHLPAIYQARKGGMIAYSFMRNESVPIHYKPGKEPPHPPGGFEWNGKMYDIKADYARAYDLVLVRSWLDDKGQVVDPTPYVFKDLSPHVRRLSRRGRFFLYDASGMERFLPPTRYPVPAEDGLF